MDRIMDDVCCILEDLTSCAKKQVSSGIDNVDINDFNAIMDGIKDMAETKYYISVTQAMEEKGDERYYTPHIKSSGNYRMGYSNDNVWQQPYIDGYLHDPNFESKMRDDYGTEPYDKWRTARKHYTETHSTADKDLMSKYAKEHLEHTIDTMKDIWSDASPDLRQKMKMDLKALIDTMA